MLTVVVLVLAAIAGRTKVFGRASAYVETFGYSTTILLLMIPTVTETLTRVPPGAPLVAGPEAPVFKLLYSILLVMFLAGVTLQVRTLRAAPGQPTDRAA